LVVAGNVPEDRVLHDQEVVMDEKKERLAIWVERRRRVWAALPVT
jgi:hypothetical protein